MKAITTSARIFILFLISSSVFFTCKEEPTKPPSPPTKSKYTVTLKEEYSSVKEIALRLSIQPNKYEGYFELMRNNTLFRSGPISPQDTIIIDRLVTPSTSYCYQLFVKEKNVTIDSSGLLILRTLDTSRAIYQWRIFDVGDYTTMLWDLAIGNDEDIWGVGYVTKPNNDTLFNAVHWNGKEWEIKRIEWHYQGNTGSSELNAVFALSYNDIWAASSAPYHFNGSYWEDNLVYKGWNFNGYVYKIWGKDGHVFFCGENGSISMWDGRKFITMQSGTTIPLIEMYGTSATDVYASGYDLNINEGIVLHYDGQSWSKVILVGTSGVDLSNLFKTHLWGRDPCVWVDETNTLYVLADCLYKRKNGVWSFAKELFENGWKVQVNNRGFLGDIKGLKSNNFFMSGAFGSLLNCNGNTSVQVAVPFSLSSLISWRRIDVKENVVCVVGSQASSFLDKGIIALGIKQ